MKITGHTKNQEYLKLSEKRQPRGVNTVMTEMLRLPEKGF